MAAILPDFSAATFESGAPINNPYFPLTPGKILAFAAEEDGETIESNQVFTTFDTRDILGIPATVVRDVAWDEGILVEDTFDWYAQDTDGNVWYLGEIATNYEYDDEGNFIGINNAGSWEAGVDGALAGYLMKANPQIGDQYFQEFAPGIAVDEAEVISLDESVSIGLGSFNNVIKTRDFTNLAPESLEFKYYAPGVGQILADEGIIEVGGEPEISPELVGIDVFAEILFGETTDDKLLGGEGDDYLDGGEGDDTIAGGLGNDTIFGRGGDDILRGDLNRRSPQGNIAGGDDIIYGGAGDDRIGGKNGNDILYGDAGDDKLWGDAGDDILRGGLGNDTLTGDDFSGGSGSDTFVLAAGEGQDKIVDFEMGIDLIGLADGLSFGQLSFSGNAIQLGDETLATLKGIDATSLSTDSFVLMETS